MVNSLMGGDSHNFQRSVEFKLRPDGTGVFQKPRSVFWELFFFGENSPLREAFAESKITMNLGLGRSHSFFENDIFEVKRVKRSPKESDFFSFGQTLAYCYYFGIQDLHRENLLLSNEGLQVVDVEQTFSDLILPNQTLLLPLRSGKNQSAGFNVLTSSSLELISCNESLAIINGFAELSKIFLKNIEKVKLVLIKLMDLFKEHPIRVFFRSTKEYADVLNKKSSIPNLLNEEIVQLKRGDIPYFFMHLGSRSTFYYSTKNWGVEKVVIPEEFSKLVSYCATDPLSLIDNQKIEKKWALGTLYLLRKMPFVQKNEINFGTYKVNRQNDRLEFIGPNMRVSCKI